MRSVHVNFRAKDDNPLKWDALCLQIHVFKGDWLSDKPESMKPLLDYLITLNYRREVKSSVIHITGIIRRSKVTD